MTALAKLEIAAESGMGCTLTWEEVLDLRGRLIGPLPDFGEGRPLRSVRKPSQTRNCRSCKHETLWPSEKPCYACIKHGEGKYNRWEPKP